MQQTLRCQRFVWDPTMLTAPTSIAVNRNTTALAATATSLIITGYGFSAAPGHADIVTFNNGVTGKVTGATVSSLTVTSLTGLTAASSLTASVTVGGVASAATQVATVVPVVTSGTANLGANATSLVIHGFGFSTTATSNVVAFSGGATGKVIHATATTLTVSSRRAELRPLARVGHQQCRDDAVLNPAA